MQNLVDFLQGKSLFVHALISPLNSSFLRLVAKQTATMGEAAAAQRCGI